MAHTAVPGCMADGVTLGAILTSYDPYFLLLSNGDPIVFQKSRGDRIKGLSSDEQFALPLDQV